MPPTTPEFHDSLVMHGPATPPVQGLSVQAQAADENSNFGAKPRSRRMSLTLGTLKAPTMPKGIKGIRSFVGNGATRIGRRFSVDKSSSTAAARQVKTPPPTFRKAMGEPDFEATRLRRHTDTSAMATMTTQESVSGDFGEAILVEILAGSNLSTKGNINPYVQVECHGAVRSSSVLKGARHPVFNERFVFWSPREVTTNDSINVSVHDRNVVKTDALLGSAVVKVDVPLNDSIDNWYELNGRGQIRIAFRRVKVENVSMLLAVQTISAHEHPVGQKDLDMYGRIVPELWYGFAETQVPDADRHRIGDTLTDKINTFGRRLFRREEELVPRRKHTIL